jgi:hypothetical protein
MFLWCPLTLYPGCAPCRVDAGKVELDGASYAGLPLPFSLTQLIVSGCWGFKPAVLARVQHICKKSACVSACV